MPHAPRFLRPVSALVLLGAFAVALAHAAEAPAPQRARDLMQAGHWKAARHLLTTTLQSTPDDPAALAAMAEVRAEFGDVDEAEKLARRAVALAPNDPQTHETLAQMCGRRAQKAGIFKGLGLAHEFRKEAERAIALDPRRIEARDMLMEFHLQAPGIAGGDKKKARQYAEEIAKLDPVRGELALAQYSQAMKDSLVVEGCFRRAVAKDPTSIDARVALASWLLAPWRGKLDEAETETRAAIAAGPDRTSGWTLLAILAIRRKDTAALDSALAGSDRNCPDARAAWYQAGRLLLTEADDPARAERCFRHYLEVEPEGGQPTLAKAHWRLAQVLAKENRPADARTELQAALRLEPDFDDAKKELKKLKG